MSRQSPKSHLTHLQLRKRRKTLSARVLVQGGKEHEDTMALMNSFRDDHEKVSMQAECWRVESEETRLFQHLMDRTVEIMASLAETIKVLSAPPPSPPPIPPQISIQQPPYIQTATYHRGLWSAYES